MILCRCMGVIDNFKRRSGRVVYAIVCKTIYEGSIPSYGSNFKCRYGRVYHPSTCNVEDNCLIQLTGSIYMKKVFTLGKDIVDISGENDTYKVKILTSDISRIDMIRKYLIDEGFLDDEWYVTFHSKIII